MAVALLAEGMRRNAVLQRHQNDPYGNVVLGNTSLSLNNPFQYAGRENDETGPLETWCSMPDSRHPLENFVFVSPATASLPGGGFGLVVAV